MVRTSQRGLSLIELMVGLTIGLFVVAGALGVLAINLRENRKLLLEARLMQDLRTASDLITRDLRHAGYWATAEQGVAAAAAVLTVNPYAAAWPASPSLDTINFNYSRDAVENDIVDSNDQIGYRLRAGAVEVHVGSGGWQALTDSATFNVTEFNITATVEPIDLSGFCSTTCWSGIGSSCSPRLEVRTLSLMLGGNLVGDAGVSRRLTSEVRVRNDTLAGACAS